MGNTCGTTRDGASMAKALITGVRGQDGRYLAELLIADGVEVVGMTRSRRPGLPEGLSDVYVGDVSDPASVGALLGHKFDEIYHLAADAIGAESEDVPLTCMRTNAIGTLNMLELADLLKARFVQAGSSEMYGDALPPQGLDTPFSPITPYAIAKVASHNLVQWYRRKRGVHASNAVLFSHESPFAPKKRLISKIARHAARVEHGETQKLVLDNYTGKRDWIHAKDAAKGLVAIMRHNEPADWVIARGMSHSVVDVARRAFEHVGIDKWQNYVKTRQHPSVPEIGHTWGDVRETTRRLGWRAEIAFEDLVNEIVDAEREILNEQR